MSFFILGMPRSRTTWLSAYFTNCYHEKSMEFSTLEQLKEFVTSNKCGISDTALLLHLDWIQQHISCPIVVIDRKYEEVVSSLVELGFKESVMLQKIREKIDTCSDVFKVRFEDIDKSLPDICRYVGEPYNKQRHIELKEMSIQPIKETLLKRMGENYENIKQLYGAWL